MSRQYGNGGRRRVGRRVPVGEGTCEGFVWAEIVADRTRRSSDRQKHGKRGRIAMRATLGLFRPRTNGAKTPTGMRLGRLVVLAAAVVVVLFVPSSGLAVHDTGAFELDGNAVAL